MTSPHDAEGVLAGWRHAHAVGEPGGLALLMLHGTGGDEREMVALGRTLSPSAALLAPRGRVSEGGMARFFSRSADDPFAFPDLAERIDELAAFVRAAVMELGWERRPLVAVGYSNGANAATGLMLRHPGLLHGAALLRGLLPAPAPPGLDLSGTRVLAAPGGADPMIPPPMAAALIATLAACGAEVTEAWAPVGHGLTEADLEGVAAWLAAFRGVSPG